MFVQFNRTAITPVWLVVFGLVVLLWSPLSVAMAVLLLLVGLAGPAAMLFLWRRPSPLQDLSSSAKSVPQLRGRIVARPGYHP